jgi:hypothetical protein
MADAYLSDSDHIAGNTWNNVSDLLPPFNKIVEVRVLEDAEPLMAGLYDFMRPQLIVRFLVHNSDKIDFIFPVQWRFVI